MSSVPNPIHLGPDMGYVVDLMNPKPDLILNPTKANGRPDGYSKGSGDPFFRGFPEEIIARARVFWSESIFQKERIPPQQIEPIDDEGRHQLILPLPRGIPSIK